MSQLILADVSEHQGTVDWAAYAAGGYPAAVARLTYGTAHTDRQAVSNIAGMRAHLRCRGYYGYLVASQDPTAQAQAFAAILKAHGGLQPGEWVCVDSEEGAGDQEARAAAWLAEVNHQLGLRPSQDVEYSGLAFVASHGGWIPGVTRWVAAYQPTAPQADQTLWQCSDNRAFPGISGACDASVFNGTVDQLLNIVNPPAPAPAPIPARPGNPAGENMILRDPTSGGVWVVADRTGAIYAYDGAPFLGGTNNPNTNPGNYPVVGICEYHDTFGVGYEIVLDWGDNGHGQSADGSGDRFRRYRFPRDGSAK